MIKLTVFNFILLIIITSLLVLVKRTVRTERAQNAVLLIASLVTVLFHYSTFIFRYITGDAAIEYLQSNPNLILPIYPCNVVMWSCLIIGLMKNRESKLYSLLVDYIFWFGIFSTLVGMFANVDFINNPTLANYDITKSIVAHATLLFNVMLLFVFKQVKIDFWQNMKHMIISVIGMYVIGIYCNLVFKVLVSPEEAYDVNSMFIIHSPFEGMDFLRYPMIAAVALVLYFILFTTCDIITNAKGNRWFDKARAAIFKNNGKSETSRQDS